MPAGSTAKEAIGFVNEKLRRLVQTKGLGDGYQGIAVGGLDDVSFAASDPSFVGVSMADRQYFKEAIAGKLSVGDAALNKATQKPFVPVVAPIRSADRVVGAVVVFLDMRFLEDLIAHEKVGQGGFALMIDSTGRVLAHPSSESVFTMNLTQLAGMEDVARRMTAGESGVGKSVFQGASYAQGFAPVKSTGWSVGLAMPDAEYLAAGNEVRFVIIAIGVAALLMTVLMQTLLARSISKPMAREVAFAELVAGGDFTQELLIRQRDEVGKLADALNAMREKLRDMVNTIQEISASARKLAEGRQSRASTLEETTASVEELAASVNQVA